MERVKALTRLAAMIAAVMLICTWIPKWYSEGELSKAAYVQLNTHLESIQKQIDDDQEYIPLMSEEDFHRELTQEELSAYVDTWLTQVIADRTYTQETQEEVKGDIIALYESQKELAKDQTYHHYVNIVRGISVTVIVLALAITCLINQKQKLNKQRSK